MSPSCRLKKPKPLTSIQKCFIYYCWLKSYLFNVHLSDPRLDSQHTLLAAAVLHQGLATVAPPTTAQTTAAPHKDPGRPEKGNYVVASSNGTACLLASMGLQLNVTFNSQNKVPKYNPPRRCLNSAGAKYTDALTSLQC